MTRLIPGYCTLCRSRCGTLNEVRDDRLVSVRPDPSHPTGQAMCMKGRAAPELVHSPHRQLYPLRRTTPKGSADPGWKRIGWDEALGETAHRLAAIRAESGAEAVAFSITTPSGTPLSDSIDWIERLVRHFGSPNICYGTEICNWHKDFAHAFTFGCGMPPADYENADTILLWGHNPANTWLAQANAIGRGRARGAKMVVVDPRPTALARQADAWLAVRPGTDAALALGLVRLLIEERRYDERFVRLWTNAPLLVRGDDGRLLRERDLSPDAPSDRYMVWDEEAGRAVPFDPERQPSPEEAFRWRIRGDVVVEARVGGASRQPLACTPAFELLARGAAPYDEGRVRDITGVPADVLRTAMELLSGGRRIAYHAWTGLGQHTNATQAERAVASLYALSGSFDRVGGNRVRRGPFYRPVNAVGHIEAAQMAKTLGAGERPIGPPAMGWVTGRDLYRAILDADPYRVRAMVAFGTNLPVSQADSGMAERALAALEFHVHCDLFETPAARHADIFLPVNTPWEHEGLRFGFEISDDAASHVQLRQRMVSPRGESRSDNEIVFELACRLGLGDAFFGGSLEAGWNHMLEPLGLSVAQLRANPAGLKCAIDSRERKYALAHHDFPERIRGFDTETRRVELYSELLHRHGQPAIASHAPPGEQTRQERDGTGRRYPLILSSAKNGYYCHSQHRSLVSLRKRAPDPVAEISPGLAASRDILDGDWIRVRTRHGQARFVAKLTPQLADDLVVAEFGWWQACPELDREATPVAGPQSRNFNSLVSAEDCDPVSGSVAHRSFRCDIERDPATEPRWRGWRAFRVSRLHPEARGVVSVHLEPVEGGVLPDYRPGQHIEIRVRIGSESVTRSYSLTGPANVPGRRSYAIAVRHQTGLGADGTPFEGRVSSHINRQLRPGDIVDLKAPSGSFVLPRRSPQPLIFLAGGIGITPFMSLLESLPDGDPTEIRLYYGNRNGDFHAFRDRIGFHVSRLPGLTVVNHYDQPLPSDRPGIDHDSAARITAGMVPDGLISRRARIYMCGPPGMMEDFARGLAERGVPDFDIFREVFKSPPGPVADDGRTFRVSFSRSREAPDLWSAACGPLLNFGESLGVTMSSGCRVGQCESCAVRIVSGSVRHLHGTEPDDASTCLACQAVPVSDVVLDA